MSFMPGCEVAGSSPAASTVPATPDVPERGRQAIYDDGMQKTEDQVAARARADHGAAALEALHSAIYQLGRAGYHLSSIGIPTPALAATADADELAVRAHALAKIVTDRLP